MGVKCPAQEENTMSLTRALTQTDRNKKNECITVCLHRMLINFKMDNNLFWLELKHFCYVNLYMMWCLRIPTVS